LSSGFEEILRFDIHNVGGNGSRLYEQLYENEVPCIISGMDIGSCVDKWRNSSYLIQGLGRGDVSIQTSSVPQIDFKQKNFQRKSLESLVEGLKLSGFNCSSRKVSHDFSYFRATPKNRSVLPDFWKQWPGVAKDVRQPDFIPTEKIFSSILRLSSAGTVLFMHYDVMDNVLLQICGRKEIILFPPKELEKLQPALPKNGNDLLCDPRCYDARRWLFRYR